MIITTIANILVSKPVFIANTVNLVIMLFELLKPVLERCNRTISDTVNRISVIALMDRVNFAIQPDNEISSGNVCDLNLEKCVYRDASSNSRDRP